MDEEKQALLVKRDVNVGFGAATEQGLTVFVVKDVRGRSIREIGAEIDRLAKAAAGRNRRAQVLGGGRFPGPPWARTGGLWGPQRASPPGRRTPAGPGCGWAAR